MVAQHGRNPWGAAWVISSLVLTVVVSVIGVTVERIDDKLLRTAVAHATGETPGADLRTVQLAARPIYVLFFSSSLVVALLFLMTNRPGLVVSIAAPVIAAVASVIAASIRVRSVRRSRRALRVDAEK